jgi:AcrR family transcriptional regulator
MFLPYVTVGVTIDSIVNSMARTPTTATAVAADSDDIAFDTSSVLRQPADELGPRAQRTIARIIEATRDVFLTRGYSGTTIDEISRLADVSRASFYTYFPSKRAVLLAVGANSAAISQEYIDRMPNNPKRPELTKWVSEYFEVLDVHGSLAFAWTQAAHDDDEIRVEGMRRHLKLSKSLGRKLVSNTAIDPVPLGLIGFSLLERSWNYGELYSDRVKRDDIVRQVAYALWAAARQPATL